MDAADHDDGAEGLRGEEGRARASRAPSTARSRGRKSWLEQRKEEEAALGYDRAALRRHHRRRAGRHRARRAAAAAGRADHHRRAQREARRLLAQALQVAVPARPGLVRPPALPAVPGRLARVLAEGQDRRLAGDVHQGDGAQLLGLDHRQEGALRRGEAGMGSRRRARRQGGRAAAEAAGVRARRLGLSERAEDPRRRKLQGRPAPLQRAPRAGGLQGQEVRRAGLQQLGPRHLRRPVGERRRRDDDPALVDAHRAARIR